MRQLMHIVNIQVLCEHEIFVFYRRVGWQCYTQWIGIVLIYKSNESEVAWNFLLVFSRVSFQFYLVSISTAAVQFHHVYIFVSTYLVSIQWIYWARFQSSDLVLLFHYSQMFAPDVRFSLHNVLRRHPQHNTHANFHIQRSNKIQGPAEPVLSSSRWPDRDSSFLTPQ